MRPLPAPPDAKATLLLLVCDMAAFLNYVCRDSDRLVRYGRVRGDVAEEQYQKAKELIGRARRVVA